MVAHLRLFRQRQKTEPGLQALWHFFVFAAWQSRHVLVMEIYGKIITEQLGIPEGTRIRRLTRCPASQALRSARLQQCWQLPGSQIAQ
jgi:hypothetical protein